MLPIDIENPYRLSTGFYRYEYIYIHMYIYIYRYISNSWHHISRDLSHCVSKFTGWAIIEKMSICRRVRTFLISRGQKTRVKHCYVDLS